MTRRLLPTLALLLRHEARLVWRGSLFGGRRGWMLLLAVAIALHGIGYLVAVGFRHVSLPPADQALGATLALLFVGGLMLSQAVQRASELLDDKTDLGWLLSTPVSWRHILTVRLLAVSGSVALYWLLLLVPLADGMALLGRRDLFGVAPMLVVLALLVTACGFAVTFALLRVAGVRRTRSLANALATVIGAAVFLSGQTRSLLPPGQSDAFWHSFTPTQEAAATGLAWLPARALLGAPGPLALLCAVAIGAALVTSLALQRWFAAGAQAVVAGSTDIARARQADGRAFAQTPWAALLGKEVRLLRRFPGLIGLAAYYLIYLVPAVAAIWHGAGHGDAKLLGAAPVLSAGELARLFISVTVMGDEAAELVQTAPVSAAARQRAKLAAAGLGVGTIMALPVGGLAAALPIAVPAMLAGMCGNVGCNLALGLWRPAPIRRTDLRRNRRGWGGLVNVVGFFFSASWSMATWLLLRGSPWAVLPAVLALAVLALCRPGERTDCSKAAMAATL